MVNINWNDVEASDFEVLPKGLYTVEVEEVESRTTKTEEEAKEQGTNPPKHPGSEYWSVRLNVREPEEYEGRKLFTNVMLPPYQPIVLYNMLKAARSDLLEAENPDIEPADLEELGPFQVRVSHRKYEGATQEDIKPSHFYPLEDDELV